MLRKLLALILMPLLANANGVYNGTITVSGGKFLNGSSVPILLRGANMSGLEYCAVDGQQPWCQGTPNWTLYATWKPNVVRIPLNAASFLGLSCAKLNSGKTGWAQYPPTLYQADPYSNYVATVDASIASAQAAGAYVILDLHWSAPQFTYNTYTEYLCPQAQPPFMNASTDLAFWQAIATRYGTQATPQTGVNNNGIMFELFNEPFIDGVPSVNGSANTFAGIFGLMLNGGSATEYQISGFSYAAPWTVEGYQTVLTAIRAIGANNVCIINGYGYTQSLQNYLQYMPTDTLSPAQLAVGWHPYPAGTYPYTNGNVYGSIGTIQPHITQVPQTDVYYDTVQFDTWAKTVIAAGVPFIITEDGGSYGPAATSLEPHVNFMTQWADNHGVSYLHWGFWPQMSATANGSDYLLTTGNVPTTGDGQVFYNWISTHQ